MDLFQEGDPDRNKKECGRDSKESTGDGTCDKSIVCDTKEVRAEISHKDGKWNHDVRQIWHRYVIQRFEKRIRSYSDRQSIINRSAPRTNCKLVSENVKASRFHLMAHRLETLVDQIRVDSKVKQDWRQGEKQIVY